MIEVRLLEASPVIAESLILFLATQADFHPVEVQDIDGLRDFRTPGSLLLISMESVGKDTWGLISRVTTEAPGVHVVLLSTDKSQPLVARALLHGVRGFIHKGANPVAFLAALRRIAAGETVVLGAPDASGDVDAEMSLESPSTLTDREIEILRLMARDHTAGHVASTLGVSIRTVHAHLQNAYRKLGVHGRIGAILEAARKGFLDENWPVAIVLVAFVIDWTPN
jgi:DNA-binding NarL/FixJ family response regulator